MPPPFRLEDWSAPFFSRISPSKGQPVSIRNFDNWIGMFLGQRPENCALSGRCECYSLIEASIRAISMCWTHGKGAILAKPPFCGLRVRPSQSNSGRIHGSAPKRADAANGFSCVGAAASATERQSETDARPLIGCANGLRCSSKRAPRGLSEWQMKLNSRKKIAFKAVFFML